jgi:hypothetical protein
VARKSNRAGAIGKWQSQKKSRSDKASFDGGAGINLISGAARLLSNDVSTLRPSVRLAAVRVAAGIDGNALKIRVFSAASVGAADFFSADK